MDEIIKKRLETMAGAMRKNALDMALAAGGSASHFGGGVSTIDILAVLYGEILHLDREDPLWEGRDRFILSKGHGVLGYYAALGEIGYIGKEEFQTFEKDGSALLGHPVQNRSKGIEFTTGSLGMGLSIGIGTALGLEKKGLNQKVYVLMGDGECNEGSVWEGLMSVPQFQLKNLVVIIDRNMLQLGGSTTDVMDVGDIAGKLKAFGWHTLEIDGHNIEEIYNALQCEEVPLAIVARTIKGKGFSFSENDNSWHHNVLTEKQYEIAMEEWRETL